jgi:hypothetical protein
MQKDIAKENVNIKIGDQDQIIKYLIPNIF